MEEVKALEGRNGGGNRLAQERWLVNVPDSERPIPGSSPQQVYKNFVERAYIEERWTGNGGALAAVSTAADAASEYSASKEPSNGKSSGSKRRDRSHKKDRKRSPRKAEVAAPDENQWQLGMYAPNGEHQLVEPWTAMGQPPEVWSTPEFGDPLAYNYTSPGLAFATYNDGYGNGFQYGVHGAMSDNGSSAGGWRVSNSVPQSPNFEQFFLQRSAPLETPQTARTADSRRVQPPTPTLSDGSGWANGMHASAQRMVASSPILGAEHGAHLCRALPSWLKASGAPASPGLQRISRSVSGSEIGPALSVGNTTLRLKPTNPWAASIGGRGSAPKEVRLAPNNPWADVVADSGRSARAAPLPYGNSTAGSARGHGNQFLSNGTSCGASDSWAEAQPPQVNSWVDAC